MHHTLAREAFAALAAGSALFFITAFTVKYADVRALERLAGIGAPLILLAGELAFRGLLQERIGLWKASVAFALLYPLLLAGSAGEMLPFALFAAAYGLLQGIVAATSGARACAAAALLYYAFSFGGWAYFASLPLSILLLALPIYFGLEKASFDAALSELGLHLGSLFANAAVGVALAFSVFFVLLALGLLFTAVGANDQHKVAEKVRGAHPVVLLTAVLLSPFSEEIFFRGFLARRFGAVMSALAFGMAHAGYGSAVEMAGALIFGYMAALVFLSTRSLVAPILAHLLLNAVAVLAFAYGRGLA